MRSPAFDSLTRREALVETLRSAIAGTLALPFSAEANPTKPQPEDTEFVPENDYPFFGGEMPEGY